MLEGECEIEVCADLGCNGESDALSSLVALSCIIRTVETSAELVELIGGDAGSIVHDIDGQLGASCVEQEHDVSAGLVVSQGIVDEVAECAFEEHFVACVVDR